MVKTIDAFGILLIGANNGFSNKLYLGTLCTYFFNAKKVSKKAFKGKPLEKPRLPDAHFNVCAGELAERKR